MTGARPASDLTVLGIGDAHDAAACVVRGGRLIAAVAEERLQRIKGMGGFPGQAISECLRLAGLKSSDIDHIVLASTMHSPFNLHNAYASFTVADHVRMQDDYWRPVLYEGADVRLADVFPDYARKGRSFYPLDGIPFAHNREVTPEVLNAISQLRKTFVAAWLGFEPSRIHAIDHHLAHAYYAYFSSSKRLQGVDVLAITADAGGDGAYESIGVFRSGRYHPVHRGRTNQLAQMYSYVTLLLGMRPNEHEYKLMGLAPYASRREKAGPLNVFREALRRDGMKFARSAEVKDLYQHFRERLKTHRFDGIAGGIQDFLEESLCGWVESAVEATGIRDIVYAGGLSLNVKANKRLLELDAVSSLSVPPGAGDESLPIGACYAFLAEIGALAVNEVPPFDHAYWGMCAGKADVAALLDHPAVRGRYESRRAGPEAIAELLDRDEIVAVFQGAMEFGPRALGHRSIIAAADRPGVVRKINHAIKMRDFWMPFAPAVLAERLSEYVQNPKRQSSPFMTLSFDTTEKGRRDLAAALHPADQTVRVQEVDQARAPAFHRILAAFERRTGVGGVLNTSLNIHGKPIVMRPVDIADEILTRDDVSLDNIYVDGTLLVRRTS